MLTELLQNAVDHAFPESFSEAADGAGNVVVHMDNDGAELTVRVRDDGVGLPDSATRRWAREGWVEGGRRQDPIDGEPSIGLDTLEQHTSGLVCLSGCAGNGAVALEAVVVTDPA